MWTPDRIRPGARGSPTAGCRLCVHQVSVFLVAPYQPECQGSIRHRAMRIVLVNYGHFASQGEPDEVLDRFHTLTGWAEALSAEGAEVGVIQGFRRDAVIERAGVRYEFVEGRFAPRLAPWRIPRRLHSRVLRFEPEIVHLNGLLFPLQVRHLRFLMPRGCPLVAQHHAERPERSFATREIQRWGLEKVDAFFFNGRELARPWIAQGQIDPQQPIFEIPEGSTHFHRSSPETSRQKTGLDGDPICLWLANLNSNKDPLTVLEGFERLLDTQPRARLYMAFPQKELLAEVEARLGTDPRLSRAVCLLGALSRAQVEAHLNSSDFLLQGSHYEGSGYSVIEAMACGVVPVVTDIPAFRFLTGRASVGALWPVGRSDLLASSVSCLLERPLDELRHETRAYFERELSYPALARKALAAYGSLVGRRREDRATTPAVSSTVSRRESSYLCPECRLAIDSQTLRCSSGHRFERRDGVLDLLSAELRLELEESRAGLQEHRDRLARRIFDEAVFDSLPEGLADDFEWRLRCHDLELVRRLLLGRDRVSILDVGSHNGWLAHHLAEAGHEVTAVDFFDDPQDGLGARRFYQRALWASVQMDLRDLSLLNREYDVVVLNRCLQFFPDPASTLQDAQRRVAADGLLIVTGLDFFRFPLRKRRAVERLRQRHFERHGRDLFLHPTRGWLDFRDRRRFRALGLRTREVGRLRSLNLLARIRPDRPRFCYGVWPAVSS